MVVAVPARQIFCRLIIGVSLGALSVGSAFAQNTDGKLAEYQALLAEIQDKKLSIAHQEAKLKYQEVEAESLRAQIESVPALVEAVPAMLSSMSAEIDKVIASDLPFKLTERYDRLAAFQESIAEGTESSPGEQMRRALSIYAIEAGYGSNVEAYPGNHPVEEFAGARFAACEADVTSAACGLDEDQEKLLNLGATVEELKPSLQDGDYLRYGRLSLVYMQHDGASAYRYDVNLKDWVELKGNRMLDVRRDVRTVSYTHLTLPTKA